MSTTPPEPRALQEPVLLLTNVVGLVITAGLLPALGILVRWIAFSASNITSPSGTYEIAWSASLAQLVATSLSALTFVLLFFTTVAIVARVAPLILRRVHPSGLLPGKGRPFFATWTFLVIGSLAAAVDVWVGFVFPIPYIAVVVATVASMAWFYAGRLEPRALFLWMTQITSGSRFTTLSSLRRLWRPLLLVMVVSALGAGLSGSLPGVDLGNYYFASPVSGIMPDGQFVKLGDAGGSVLLLNCTSRTVVEVSSGAIRLVEMRNPGSHPMPSSLWELMHGGSLRFGFQPPC